MKVKLTFDVANKSKGGRRYVSYVVSSDLELFGRMSKARGLDTLASVDIVAPNGRTFRLIGPSGPISKLATMEDIESFCRYLWGRVWVLNRPGNPYDRS